MRFLFRLDLSLYAGAGKKIGILNFATKQGASWYERESKRERRHGNIFESAARH